MMNVVTRYGCGRERSDEGTCGRVVRLGKVRGYRFAALIALANVGCGGGAGMSVSRHMTTNLPESRVAEIFSDSWTVLNTNDPPDDVSCNVAALQEARSIHTVGVFNTGSGTINIPEDLKAVDGQSGFVKVVNEINWCEGFISVRGCSTTPGKHIVVIRHENPDLEGQLWAHEYGHTRGNRDVVVPTRLMNSYTVETARRVTSSECDKFKK
jgi:hypothetical protein